MNRATAGERSSSTPKSLRANFSWTAFGNVVYALCQWAVISAIAKFGTPTMVGQFAFALALTTPVFQFSSLSLRQIQATDAKREHPFGDYLSLRCITTILAIAAMLAGVVLLDEQGGAAIVIVLVTFAKAADAISDVCYGSFQQQEQMDLVSKALMLKGILALTLVIVAFLASGNFMWAMAGYLVGSLLPTLVFVLPTAARLERTRYRGLIHLALGADRNSIGRLLRQSLPLGVVVLLVSLNPNIPRYFVEHQLGEYALGIFAALVYLLVAGTTLVSALAQAVSPRLSQYYAAGKTDLFMRMLLKLMALGLSLGIAGSVLAALVGSQILALLYGDEYGAYTDVLVVIAMAGGLSFAASFAGYGITAARQFGIQVPMFMGVCGTGIVSSALLIPEFGLKGAAVVLLVTAFVQLAASVIVIWKKVSRREEFPVSPL